MYADHTVCLERKRQHRRVLTISVLYDGNAIIPGPFVGIQKEYVLSEDGRVRRKFFSITLKGKLVAYAGSPRSDGSFWNQGAADPPPNEYIPADSRLAAIRSKQGALLQIFSTSGRTFEIQPFDGTPSIKCNPRIKGVEFGEGKWVDTCDFTISMEADNVWFGTQDGGGGLTGIEPEESWSIEVENPNTRVYRVSHTISSQQRATFDDYGNVLAEGWENAQFIVEPYVGTPLPAAMVPPELSNYYTTNYARSQTVDQANGRYSVTENYLYIWNQPWVEEFTVNSRLQEGQSHVSVEGTITGYAQSELFPTPLEFAAEKFSNAQAGWTLAYPGLLTRAQNYSGVALNPLPLNSTVGYNPTTGAITYNFEFDNRPTNLVPGSLSETLTVQQQNPTDVIAQLLVLGRAAGPVLQDIGTMTAKVRTVSFEVVISPAVIGKPLPVAPDVTGILMTYYPGGYLTRDEESWTARTGRYSRSVSWTYE